MIRSIAVASALFSLAASRSSKAVDCAYVQTIATVSGYGHGGAAAAFATDVHNALVPAPAAACKSLIGVNVGTHTISLGPGPAIQFPAAGSITARLPDLTSRGSIPYATIDNVRQALLAAPAAQVPLFSVIDSNAAHHFSEPLIRFAFAGSARPRAIVQIDQHPDITSGSVTGNIDCTNWGRFALGAAKYAAGVIPAAGPHAPPQNHHAVFVWVGPQSPPLADHYTVKSYTTAGTVAATANSNGAGLGAAVLAAITNALPAGAFDVYVSVDRDFHGYGATGWDVFGKHNPVQARAAVTSIVNQFAPAGNGHLRGMDVVGMAKIGGGVDATAWHGLGLPSDPNKKRETLADIASAWAAAQPNLRQ
jgi:hypothetical protein